MIQPLFRAEILKEISLVFLVETMTPKRPFEINWPLVYFILKVFAWEICNMEWGFTKKVIIKSQRPFMYGSNVYGSDVITGADCNRLIQNYGCR